MLDSTSCTRRTRGLLVLGDMQTATDADHRAIAVSICPHECTSMRARHWELQAKSLHLNARPGSVGMVALPSSGIPRSNSSNLIGSGHDAQNYGYHGATTGMGGHTPQTAHATGYSGLLSLRTKASRTVIRLW